jgi:sugar phosphate isomerase/epimerase
MPVAAFPKCYLDAMLRDRTMSTADWVGIGASLSLDGVELYWPAIRELSDDQLVALRASAEDLGVALPMLCASPDFTVPTREAFEAEIADEARAIAATARLGGRWTRILSGQRRPDVTREDGIARAVEAIERLLPVAEAAGVTLAMENHVRDYYWEHNEFAQQADLFLEIVASIPTGAPFGVQFDPSNALVTGDDPVWFLEQVKERVVTAAASDRYWTTDADGSRRVVHAVVGEGRIDHDALCAILASVGFDGWISIEDGDDPATGPDDIERSAAHIRAVMARHGLR